MGDIKIFHDLNRENQLHQDNAVRLLLVDDTFILYFVMLNWGVGTYIMNRTDTFKYTQTL